MKNRRKIKGEHNLRYNLTTWNKNDAFDILHYISEDVTLVQCCSRSPGRMPCANYVAVEFQPRTVDNSALDSRCPARIL